MAMLHNHRQAPFLPNRGKISTWSLDIPAGVLLADGDEVARSFLGDFFRQHHLPVWLASDGEEAVEVYRDFGGQIAMVLMDIDLPNVGGRPVADLLQELNPDIAVYFMTDSHGCDNEQDSSSDVTPVRVKPSYLTWLSSGFRQNLANEENINDLNRALQFMTPYFETMVGDLIQHCQQSPDLVARCD